MRYLSLLKNAWLIAWNLALLCLVVAVPVSAIWQAGWVAVWFFVVLGFAFFVWRHPSFIFGMWLGGRN